MIITALLLLLLTGVLMWSIVGPRILGPARQAAAALRISRLAEQVAAAAQAAAKPPPW